MKISRLWAMPNHNTFDIDVIGNFVKRFLADSKVRSIDPFARNKRWATYTNDLNPNTLAEYHLDCLEFLTMLLNDGIKADLVIFDPPYSPTQIKEMYESIGLDRLYRSGEECWVRERNIIERLLNPGGYVLSFGWNSIGMGKSRGFVIQEIMLVAHGAGHNDTICMAEQKLAHQIEML